MVAEVASKIVPTPSVSYDQSFRWSVERYQRAIEVGVFGPDDRVEMLEGEIIQKMPQDFPHIDGIRLLVEVLREILGLNYHVNAQLPILTLDSVPEPDIMVLRGRARDFLGRYPVPEEIALVAEVSNTTLTTDRRRKVGIYARANFAEYWILNVADRQLEVHRTPLPTGIYADSHIYGADATVTIEGREVRVADLLP